MQLIYLLLLIILLATYGFVLNTARKSAVGLTPILGWMVGLAYFALLPLTLLTLNRGFKYPDSYDLSGTWWDLDLSRSRFLYPYVVIWLSLMLTCGVAYFFGPAAGQKQGIEYIISRRKLERVILTTMVLAVVDWIATIWLLGGIEEFLVSHWYTRAQPLIERFGSVYILIMRLSLVNQILFTGAAALYAGRGLKHRNTRWGFTSLILCFLLLGVIMSGNRIFVALYLLAFLTSCALYGRWKILAALLGASPLIVLVFSVWAWVRHDIIEIPDALDRYAIEADTGPQGVNILMEASDPSGVMLLMNIIDDYGNKYDYLYGSTYVRLFTFFQPRNLFPERTPDFATITAQVYEPGVTTTLGSTALGEAYANFGALSIFIVPLFTWLTLWYSAWLTAAWEKHSILSAVSFVMLIWFARSTFAENSMTLIGAAILIGALRIERGLCVRTTAGKGLTSAGPPSIFPLASTDPSA